MPSPPLYIQDARALHPARPQETVEYVRRQAALRKEEAIGCSPRVSVELPTSSITDKGETLPAWACF